MIKTLSNNIMKINVTVRCTLDMALFHHWRKTISMVGAMDEMICWKEYIEDLIHILFAYNSHINRPDKYTYMVTWWLIQTCWFICFEMSINISAFSLFLLGIHNPIRSRFLFLNPPRDIFVFLDFLKEKFNCPYLNVWSFFPLALVMIWSQSISFHNVSTVEQSVNEKGSWLPFYIQQ